MYLFIFCLFIYILRLVRMPLFADPIMQTCAARACSNECSSQCTYLSIHLSIYIYIYIHTCCDMLQQSSRY